MSAKYPEIARRFNQIMNIRNIRAGELAIKVDTSPATISHYVHGSRCPSSEMALRLSKVLKCSPMWLMDLSPEMEEKKSQHNLMFTDELGNIYYKLDKTAQARVLAYAQALYDTQTNKPIDPSDDFREV